MKRMMVTILAFAFLFVGVAYSETGQDIQPGGKDQELTLPNVADYFGKPVDSGYLRIATDFSGNYDLFRPATLDQIERYRARMEVLGYEVSVAETKDDVQMWLFSSDGMPFLVLAFSDQQAVLCLKDGIETPTPSPVPLPTLLPVPLPSDDPIPYPKSICLSCYGTGTCSFCNGSGIYRMYGVTTVCGACGGTGVCGVCGGTGRY